MPGVPRDQPIDLIDGLQLMKWFYIVFAGE
jgi:hypothetical protein